MRLGHNRFKAYLYSTGIFINLQIRLGRKNKSILTDLQNKSARNLPAGKANSTWQLENRYWKCYTLCPPEGSVVSLVTTAGTIKNSGIKFCIFKKFLSKLSGEKISTHWRKNLDICHYISVIRLKWYHKRWSGFQNHFVPMN